MAFPDAFKNAKKKMKGKKGKPEPKKGGKKGEPKKGEKVPGNRFSDKFGEGNPFDEMMKKEEE